MAFKKSNTNTKGNESPIYEVLEKCGIISTNGDWKTELRYISWNGREPKYDLRPWKDDLDGEKCGKGITLTGEEMENLMNLLNTMATEN